MKTEFISRAWPALALTMLLGALLPIASVRSQGKPKPKPTPSATPAAAATPEGGMARIRFWKTELKAFPSLRLTFRVGEGSKAVAREVGTGGPGYLFNEYVDVPTGRGVFELFAGQDKQAVASLPAELTQKLYVTMLLSEPAKAGEPPHMELVDDGEVGSVVPAQITVRNFVAELKDVRVSYGEKLSAQFDTGVGYLLMRGIAPASYRVQTTGTLASGDPFSWTTEVDLHQNRRQTLLIYPDPYGRIRPRISIDGEIPSAAPEKDDRR